MRVTLLGTGFPPPDARRAGSCVLVESGDAKLLVDTGRGAVLRLAQAGVACSDIAAVCLTHHHSDHIMALPDVATARWFLGRADPLPVIAATGPAAAYAERCLDAFPDASFHAQGAGRPAIAVAAFAVPARPTRVAEVGDMTVHAAAVHHPPITPAVAYRVQTAARSVVVSGDTAVCASLDELCRDVDLLVHEAVDERWAVAAGWEHLLEGNAAATAVGALAQRCRVRHLVLTHLIPPPTGEHVEQRFVDQARASYAGDVTVAADLARFDLEAG